MSDRPQIKPTKALADLDSVLEKSSIVDIIMNDSHHQAMEVVEHILHTVTDIGLHYTMTDQFGVTKDSAIYTVMQEAITNKFYNTASYNEFPAGETKDRILIQEFAYWIITSAWNFQETYGLGEGEWTLKNAELLEANLPAAHTLYETYITKIMSAPQESTLQSFDGAWGAYRRSLMVGRNARCG